MIQVIDDFVSEEYAEWMREGAIKAGFRDEVGPDGAVYQGICKDFDPHLTLHIEAIMGQRIVPGSGFGVFRRDKKGMFSYNTCHSDQVCAQYAAILYLTDPRYQQGGTGFFRHKETGYIQHPAPQHEGDPLPDYLVKQWNDESQWLMHAWVGLAWRRLAIYPSTYYHGRFPREGHGVSDEDSRLIYLMFFDVDKNPDSDNSRDSMQILKREYDFKIGPTSPLNNDQKDRLKRLVEAGDVEVVDQLTAPQTQTPPAVDPDVHEVAAEQTPDPEPEPASEETDGDAAPTEPEDEAQEEPEVSGESDEEDEEVSPPA